MINKGLRTTLICVGLGLFWWVRITVTSGTPNIFVQYGAPYQVTSGGMIYTYQDPIINYALYYSALAVAVLMSLAGCYIWTRLKNRHWLFTFWGLLTPIGLLGISLLRDKSNRSDESVAPEK